MTLAWKRITCHNCEGHGQVANYGSFGLDFEGPEECNSCEGSGSIWQSPKGRLAKYPGGPFIGRLTAKEFQDVSLP